MIGLTFDSDTISAAIISDGGDFLSRATVPCPQTDRRDWLLAVRALLEQIEAPKGTVGVAVPAILHNGLIKFTPQSFLADADLRRDLQSTLGRPIQLCGIGTALGLGATHSMDMSGMAVTMWIGQHCHGGILVDGTPLDGAHGAAGNWAHLQLPSPVAHELEGRPCWCGRTGCLDAFLSTSGLELDHERLTNDTRSAADIATAATAGDIVCESVMQVFEDRLGRATANIISITDPQRIILAGTLPELQRFAERVPRKWPGYVQIDRSQTNFVVLDEGIDLVLTGAASLTA